MRASCLAQVAFSIDCIIKIVEKPRGGVGYLASSRMPAPNQAPALFSTDGVSYLDCSHGGFWKTPIAGETSTQAGQLPSAAGAVELGNNMHTEQHKLSKNSHHSCYHDWWPYGHAVSHRPRVRALHMCEHFRHCHNWIEAGKVCLPSEPVPRRNPP